MAKIVLHGHDSFDTAYLQYDYPFGYQIRCLRKVWLERPSKGLGRGKVRFAACTTVKAWNQRYTNHLNDDPLTVADWVASNNTAWNKPKYGTYYPFALMYEDTEKSKDQASPYVEYTALNVYSGAEEFYKFYDEFYHQMDDTERMQFMVLAQAHRDKSWAEVEEKRGCAELRNLVV